MTTATKKTVQRRAVKVDRPADCGLVLFNEDNGRDGLPPGLSDDPVRGHLVGGTVQFRPWQNGEPGTPVDVDLSKIHFTQFCQTQHENWDKHRGALAIKTMVDALLDLCEQCNDYTMFDGLIGLSYVVNSMVEE